MEIAPSVFESFNAKNLSPLQVARTFVPPAKFLNISRRRHSLIIGPRGSGKTTLLKMLQQEALCTWVHPQAERYREAIDFNGVFIPTDRVWKEQIDSLGKVGFTEEQRELFSTSVFTSHVLYRLAYTFAYSSKSAGISEHEGLIEDLSKLWKLNVKALSFRSLLSALTIRKSDIPAISNSLKRKKESERNSILSESQNDFLYLELVQAVNSAIDIFSHYVKLKSDNWALLFDELELAPICVINKLVDSLRGSSDRVLFKLSMAPFSPDAKIIPDIFSAMPGNDHEIVLLWNQKKNELSKEFSKQLLNSILIDRGLADQSFDKFFRKPMLVTSKSLFEKAYESDISFRKYLDEKKLRIQQMDHWPAEIRDSVTRKVAPILRIRTVARRPQKDRAAPQYAGLKALPDYYAGVDQLFDILEGNPRWIIGVMTALIDEYQATGKKVVIDRQLKEIKSAMDKFLYLLKTIPSPFLKPGSAGRTNQQGVEYAIELIGNYFKEKTILDDFRDQPFGSFTVDHNVPRDVQKCLGAALNAGALVHISKNSSEALLGNLEGHRFRLSYLIAPKYLLPITLMTPKSLHKILEKEKGKYELSLF